MINKKDQIVDEFLERRHMTLREALDYFRKTPGYMTKEEIAYHKKTGKYLYITEKC